MDNSISQRDLFEQSQKGNPDRVYKIKFQHGFDFRGAGESVVGVQVDGTSQRVYYIVEDSRFPQSERLINPALNELSDSCANCGFHRNSSTTSFKETGQGINCTRFSSYNNSSTRTLPSKDGIHFESGAICPQHITYGTNEWTEYVLGNFGAATISSIGGEEGYCEQNFVDFHRITRWGPDTSPEVKIEYKK